MSQNVYQFTDLQRVGPPKKSLKIRKTESTEIYEPFSRGQTKVQAGCCLSYGNPCREWKCLVRNYIPDWLKLASGGHISEAAELSYRTNTLPEACGRACPQDRLCEGSYTLNDELGVVTIDNIERYTNGKVFEVGWCPDMTGMRQTDKCVAIIGVGPTGLVCADVLTYNDIEAVVFNCRPEIGGLLTFGISVFKLEREAMTRRRKIFTDIDIGFKLNVEAGRDVQLDSLLKDYGAVFLGVSTYQSVRGGSENEDASGVFDALPFLIANTKQLMGFGESSDKPYISVESKRVVVLDGDDTAMDCVWISVCWNATHVIYTCRRNEENIPGSKREVKNAREEGVEFQFNVQPSGVEANVNGKVCGVEMACTEMDEPNTRSRRRVKVIAGSEHVVPVDVVLLAFGFRPHSMEWLKEHSVELDFQGRITVPEHSNNASQTNDPKIFISDDIVRDSDLVAIAIAEGRKATDGILNYPEV